MGTIHGPDPISQYKAETSGVSAIVAQVTIAQRILLHTWKQSARTRIGYI